MELPNIPQDDMMDVIEMTDKLEEYIQTILAGNEKNLAMSALMSATINCMMSPCKTFTEIMFYRNLFVQILDETIKQIEIKNPEKPFFS